MNAASESTAAIHTDLWPQCDLANSLIEFWIRGRKDGGLPDRHHFHLAKLKPWLGYLSIYECVEQLSDFRNRLEGMHVAALTGENWQGRLASEVDSRFETSFSGDLRRVAVWRYPMRSQCNVFQKPDVLIDRILLPVTVDGDQVDQVFLALLPRRHAISQTPGVANDASPLPR